MSPESFSYFMFLYQNLTNFVEFDNKVNQLWFSDLDEDRFSGQENLTNWIYERSESFKTIFRCEWAVVASEFEFKNLPKFRQLFLLRLRDEFHRKLIFEKIRSKWPIKVNASPKSWRKEELIDAPHNIFLPWFICFTMTKTHSVQDKCSCAKHDITQPYKKSAENYSLKCHKSLNSNSDDTAAHSQQKIGSKDSERSFDSIDQLFGARKWILIEISWSNLQSIFT